MFILVVNSMKGHVVYYGPFVSEQQAARHVERLRGMESESISWRIAPLVPSSS